MTVMALHVPQRDPRVTAPAGCYLTDGKRLVEILESDHSGALAEDQLTHEWIQIEPVDLMQRWRRVTAAVDEQ